MNILIIFLIYLKMCICHWSEVHFEITEADREKFPWMVVIAKPTSLVAYGALIHKQVVLTLARIEIEHTYFDFQIFAECYFTGLDALVNNDNYRCPTVRDVKEYNIIEDNKKYYRKNLAVLTLTKPFELSKKLNVINLRRNQPEFNPDLCVIFSLRTVLNLQTNGRVRQFCSTLLSVYNETYGIKQLYLRDGNVSTINFREQSESFQQFSDIDYEEEFFGGPVVCKPVEDNNSPWIPIGVSNLSIKNYPKAEKLKLTGEIIKIDDRCREIFGKFINASYTPGEKIESQFNSR